jgi:uncharacterized Zn finger protein
VGRIVMPDYLECRGCHSDDVSIIKKDPVLHLHLTDHIVTYRCNTCGATWTVGEGRT